MTRLVDWRDRLQAYLQGVARVPFDYGTHDCALFAADAVCAMTGVDFGGSYRGRYTTLRGGLQILRGDGFADHVELARAQFSAVPVALAGPGDLAVFEAEAGRALGVVQGAMVYVLTPSGMLGLMPLTDAIEAFTV